VIVSLPPAANSGQYLATVHVVVEQTLVDEAVHDRGDDALGGREAHRHRVAIPRGAVDVTHAGPDVDDELTTVVHGHRIPPRAGALRHQCVDLLRDRSEIGVDEAFHTLFLSAVT
jgi:hypothetical protein